MRSTTIVRKPQPEGNQAPVVQRIRLRYAKRGRMRFTSHRDFARTFERALLRAGVPIAYSQGFTPHPKISYASAAPTGVASEAEYLEIAVREPVDPRQLRLALDAALPPGLDVLAAVDAGGESALAIDASAWRVELPGVAPEALRAAVRAFLDAPEVPVQRLTKNGRRTVDARAAVVRADVPQPTTTAPSGVAAAQCAILDLVVRQVTPSVRPDDVLSGLRVVADLAMPAPPRATRLAQGTLTAQQNIVDPLQVGQDTAVSGASSS